MKIRLSLEAQLTIFLFVLIACIIGLFSLINLWFDNLLHSALVSGVLIFPLSLTVLRLYMNSINRILLALKDGFHNFLDNDFSVSLANIRNDELGDLIDIYNRVGETLRDERLHLYQRELLLDTVIQTTPLCLILIDDSGAIIYSNSAARKLFHQGKAINGLNFKQILETKQKPFLRSVESGLSGLFTVTEKDGNETYHLTQNQFLLNGRKHQLYLFKSLTKEISRQEVNTWKKVIRLISHELNNSLAPITSLAHSGQTLCERQDEKKLGTIFATMGERADYLKSFIEGYARFSKLPKPQCKKINAYTFLSGLLQVKKFKLDCTQEAANIYCDPAQLQQVIINLVKNAHESGTQSDEVSLSIRVLDKSFEVQIKDRGKGMSETNLSNALLPFYSTKSEGTGLGLPLCKEIIEAHGGKILIANRFNGGLKVTLILPNLITEQAS